jgi:hypothetical protein
MIEIEFRARARQCLDRRISTIEQLENEVLASIKEPSGKEIQIDWQFSIEAARNKMNIHYRRVFTTNIKYKKT